MPNKLYKGQTLIKPVIKKITAINSKIIANVPVKTCVKNSTAINAAISILNTLSNAPIFFFIKKILSTVKVLIKISMACDFSHQEA